MIKTQKEKNDNPVIYCTVQRSRTLPKSKTRDKLARVGIYAINDRCLFKKEKR